VGDIIVFHKPGSWSELIVHRAVDKYETGDGYYFVTKGDNNGSKDPYPVPEQNLVGKVIGRIPWIGYIRIALGTNTSLILLVVIVLIIIFSDEIIRVLKKVLGTSKTSTT